MIILLPLLMAYSLIGETAHEWLGLLMFLLFILHHSMNSAWLRMLFKGRYTPLRIYITGINFLLLIVMFLQPISGFLLSKHIFHFSGFGGISFARTVHLLLAYWGFILMSIHVGNHRLWVRKKILHHLTLQKCLLRQRIFQKSWNLPKPTRRALLSISPLIFLRRECWKFMNPSAGCLPAV